MVFPITAKITIIYRQIPGRFFLLVNSISIKVFKVADSEFYVFGIIRIMVFRIFMKYPIYREILEEIFFFFSFNLISIKVFKVADSEFYVFCFIRIMVFRIFMKYPIYREILEEIIEFLGFRSF